MLKNAIAQSDYRKQDWIVHALAADFELRDCWRLPIKTSRQMQDLLPIFLTIDPVDAHPLARMLFALRMVIGKAFKLDQNFGVIPKTGERSISERLAGNEAGVWPFQMPEGSSFALFRPVYLNQNEALLELSNKTIYALVHLGKVGDEVWMGIYTKSYDWFSDLYMALIKPFRHFVVYPLWLRYLQKEWESKARSCPGFF